jgi:hypothetical protein
MVLGVPSGVQCGYCKLYGHEKDCRKKQRNWQGRHDRRHSQGPYLVVPLLRRALVLCLQRSSRFLPCFVASLLQLKPLLMGLQLRLLVPHLLLRHVYHPDGFLTLVPLFITCPLCLLPIHLSLFDFFWCSYCFACSSTHHATSVCGSNHWSWLSHNPWVWFLLCSGSSYGPFGGNWAYVSRFTTPMGDWLVVSSFTRFDSPITRFSYICVSYFVYRFFCAVAS